MDQVTIEPDGAWSTPTDSDPVKVGGGTPATDDDDVIDITDLAAKSVKQEPLPPSIALERTPAHSREASTPSSAARLSSKKRPVTVIDLTGSDEESPAPPPKRPHLSVPMRPLSRPDHPHLPTDSPLYGRPYPPSM